jgi:hypothetical protein
MYSLILPSVAPAVLKHLDGISVGSGLSAWKALLRQYEKADPDARLNNLIQLFTMKKMAGTSFIATVCSMRMEWAKRVWRGCSQCLYINSGE